MAKKKEEVREFEVKNENKKVIPVESSSVVKNPHLITEEDVGK